MKGKSLVKLLLVEIWIHGYFEIWIYGNYLTFV